MKIKFSDFTQQTRSKTIEHFPEANSIWEMAQELLNQEEIPKPVRLLGLGLSNLNITEDIQYIGGQLKIQFKI